MTKRHVLGALLIGAVLTESAAGQQAAPGNLVATAAGPTTVTLKWTGAAGANGYVVVRALGSNSFERLNPKKLSASSTSYTDADAPPGSALRYRVRAVFGPGQTSASAVVTVSTPGAPSNTASTTEPAVAANVGARVAGRAEVRPFPGYTPQVGTVLRAVEPAPSATPAPAGAEPAAPDPTGFGASIQGNKITLSWQAVPGVAWYVLGGPGMGLSGKQVQGTSYIFDSPGPGQHSWTVASLAGQGQSPINNGAGWPKAALVIESNTGNYRLIVTGLRSESATRDDWWSRDGKWDEVYVSAYVQTFDRTTGQLLGARTVKSPVHGDINGFTPGSRVRAGSASDLGGIVTGDQVAPVFGQPAPGAAGYPLLTLWQGTLTSDREVVVIHPVLWEADVGAGNTFSYDTWRQFLERNPMRDWEIPSVQQPDPQALSWFQESPPVPLYGPTVFMMGLGGNGADRPIGLEHTTNAYCSGDNCAYWKDRLLVLTRERIERALANSSSADRGVLELELMDYYRTGDGRRVKWSALDGHYVLFLKVERF